MLNLTEGYSGSLTEKLLHFGRQSEDARSGIDDHDHARKRNETAHQAAMHRLTQKDYSCW